MAINPVLSTVTSIQTTSKGDPLANSGTPANAGQSAYQWLLAWAIILVLMNLINRTRVGHVTIYYSLWLMLVFLLVTQYQFFAKALEPLNTPVPTGTK